MESNNLSVFREYVDRMKEIRLLSTPDLDKITNADEYSRLLVDNFSKIGEMARENRKVIDEFIKPYLSRDSRINEHIKEELTLFSELLVEDSSNGEVDAHLAELLHDMLMMSEIGPDDAADDSARVIAMAKKVRRDYLIVSALSRYDNEELREVRSRAIENAEQLAKYLDKEKYIGLSEDAKGMLLQLNLMSALLYENNLQAMPSEYWQPCLAILDNGYGRLSDPFYRSSLPDYDWEAYEFRIYYYASFLAYSILPEDIAKRVYSYAQKALAFIRQTRSELIRSAVNEEQMRDLLYMASVQAKYTSAREACDMFYNEYLKVDRSDYSITGINKNLDTPSSYLLISKTMDLELSERDYDRYYEIEKNMLDYLYHIPKHSDVYLKCITLFINLPLYFREVPNAMSMEDFCVNGLAATHPPTYVHVNMVARLAECMARHLLKTQPELFIGFPGCETAEDVLASKDRILYYTYRASLCHDIGKLFIIDTISMYGRALLDDEFSIIKNHPVIGADIALEHPSTRDYADVIKGHHLWYDCSRGYPAGFDTFKSPYKTVIDIVLAADCLDAATDTVGRSYNRGKTFSDYEKEVQEGAGTHYAPFLVDLFQVPALREDIEYLLSEGRRTLYRETFRLLKRNEA